MKMATRWKFFFNEQSLISLSCFFRKIKAMIHPHVLLRQSNVCVVYFAAICDTIGSMTDLD